MGKIFSVDFPLKIYIFIKLIIHFYIEILYHPILKMIAVRETTKENPYALRWVDHKGNNKFALNAQAFSKSVYDRIGWKHEYSFKFRGISRVRGNAKIIVFYLDEPQIIPNKKSKNNEQYLEIKQAESSEATSTKRKMLVSEFWSSQANFGISLRLSKKRDWIVHSVSEQDIQASGIYVENPLIGALPSQDEIITELEALIEAM